MTRSLRRANDKHAKAKRGLALARIELGQPSVPRVPATGVTSMAVKAVSAEDRRLIDDALAKREQVVN